MIDETPMEDSVINEALLLMINSKRRKNIQAWVTKLATMPKLKEKVAKGLCKKGILKEEETKILLLFKSNRYPEVDPQPER